MFEAFIIAIALNQPPAFERPANVEQQIQQVLATFDRLYASEMSDADRIAQAKEAVRHLKLDQVSGPQLGKLFNHAAMLQDAGIAQDVTDRLASMLDAPGADGATARILLFNRRLKQAPDLDAKVALYRETFSDPAVDQAVEAGAVNIFWMASPEDPKLIDAVLEDFLSLQRFIDEKYAIAQAPDFPRYLEALLAAQERGHKLDVKPIRSKMVAVAESTLGKLPRKDLETFMADVIAFLKGAYARGELLNHPAPNPKFLWSSDPKIASLHDLKGRIVVLEFWATWCGPCVAGIPHMRQLRERFTEQDVAIISVTAVEGGIIWPDGTSTDCRGDAKREFELMAEYIKRQQINYTVAFIADEVKGDFGVRGIPHIALLDAQGIVRFRDMHPAQSREVLAARIDALLKMR